METKQLFTSRDGELFKIDLGYGISIEKERATIGKQKNTLCYQKHLNTNWNRIMFFVRKT